jgi:glyoxylase I family protein
MVQEFRKKLQAGIASQFIDHGPYHSLYFTDPNGLNLEITFRLTTRDQEVALRKVARRTLDSWVSRSADQRR